MQGCRFALDRLVFQLLQLGLVRGGLFTNDGFKLRKEDPTSKGGQSHAIGSYLMNLIFE